MGLLIGVSAAPALASPSANPGTTLDPRPPAGPEDGFPGERPDGFADTLAGLEAALGAVPTDEIPIEEDVAPGRPALDARSALLYDAQTGRTVYAKNAREERPVASLTKVMTAYVVLQEGRLDTKIRITQADVRHALANGATHAGLRAGEVLTARELLYALMLESASDAAEALARTYGPGQEAFVAKMNRYAAELGMDQTFYANPDGLPDPDRNGRLGLSTAADQVRLARLALLDPVFSSIVNTSRYTLPTGPGRDAHSWRNTNAMLRTYPDALGVKTGFTNAAGFCLLFAADRDGWLIVGAVLDEYSSASRYHDAAHLLDWAYSA
ncbi:D-alanyl-D-alanine carboxypeptidase family protein [Rhizohabitans arisaemae]|uniref:D-alanyl-D-alanine carboxypeptidase family protein n=1 Tax=Rhizohabitans arisaemae TaxID=2720610 RepID=UPI0024B11618|nr:D-alanyl-D-alanine carboxypeptidase family protein [Rhizohabitans arisaemae]